MHPLNRIIERFGFRISKPQGNFRFERIFPLSLDYEVFPKRRWTEASPNYKLAEIISKNSSAQLSTLASFSGYNDYFKKIPVHGDQGRPDPSWVNYFISGIDGMSLYSFIAQRKPATYLEIGSGNSTKFVRRAIHDHKLATKIISVDPAPRTEIDTICDQVIRTPLEAANLRQLAKTLKPNDVVFFDGSHRCFQNSDVTVFFTELLFLLPMGILIGVHDIFLPYDYPEEWSTRYYSEQYLLAAILLGDQSSKIVIRLPLFFLCQHGHSAKLLKSTWDQVFPAGAYEAGSSFWFEFQL